MKKNKVLSLVVITFLILMSGCSIHQPSDDDNPLEPSAVEQLLLEKAQMTDTEIAKISLKYSEIEDFGDYYSFNCESEKKRYEGMAIISSDEVKKMDLAEIDAEAAFTVHIFSGSIKNEDDSKSLFFACSGEVHDDSIVKVHVFLTGEVMYEVQIGERKSYDIVIAHNQPTVVKIDAIDENGSVVCSYPPYPPIQ